MESKVKTVGHGKVYTEDGQEIDVPSFLTVEAKTQDGKRGWVFKFDGEEGKTRGLFLQEGAPASHVVNGFSWLRHAKEGNTKKCN